MKLCVDLQNCEKVKHKCVNKSTWLTNNCAYTCGFCSKCIPMTLKNARKNPAWKLQGIDIATTLTDEYLNDSTRAFAVWRMCKLLSLESLIPLFSQQANAKS